MRQLEILFIIFYLILNYNIVNSSEVTSFEKPIVIKADKIEYSMESKEIQAEGKVSLVYNNLELQAETIKTWLDKEELWAKGKILIIQNEKKMSGEQLSYNWKENKGSITLAKTSVENIFLKGERIKFSSEISEIEGSSITACDRDSPHYHLKAKRVVIYPKKVVAKKVSLWVGNNHIINFPYLMFPLRKKSGEKEGGLPFPRLGYDKEDKIFISGKWQGAVFRKYLYEMNYYCSLSSPFLIDVGIMKEEESQNLKMGAGKVRVKDINHKNVTVYHLPSIVWQRKWDKVHRHAEVDLIIKGGRIEEDSKIKSDYLSAKLTLKKDKIDLRNIHIFDYLTYKISGDRRWYNSKNRYIFSTLLSLSKKYKDKLNFNLGYQYRGESGDTPFKFDKIDLTKELNSDIYYKMDKDTAISIQSRYDLVRNSFYEINYAWEKIWHCFKTKLIYYRYEKTLEAEVGLIGW